MSLGKQTIDTLKRLASDGPAAVAALAGSSDPSGSITVAAETAEARIGIADLDRFSIAFRTLDVRRAAASPGDPRNWLSAHAATLIRSLAFLEEPLAVWELDGSERLAQLRSSPPQRDGDEVIYWEVALRLADQPVATLARYRWAPGMPERERVDYPATFALTGRMVAALEDGLADEP